MVIHISILVLFLTNLAFTYAINSTNITQQLHNMELLWKEFKLQNGKIYSSKEEDINRSVASNMYRTFLAK